MLSDAHCHLSANTELAKEQQRLNIIAIINCESPQEYVINRALTQGYSHQYLSAGIHPWQVETVSWSSMLPILNEAKLIGEIGLDNVWSTIALDKQRRLFEQQLAFAFRYKKPVILHTKGCEQEIAKTISHYPNRYLVHWYSDKNYLADYIALGCYFSIGPDVMNNTVVQHIAKTVPLSRLLVESDGLSAIEWAQKRPITVYEYQASLLQSINYIAMLRATSAEKIKQVCYKNLLHFITP